MNRNLEAGFTLIDILMVVVVAGILAAIAVPSFSNLADSLELSTNAREVERELQTARLRAVTSNRPIRIRFNCPVSGQYRMVEVIGSASAPHTNDEAANRCQETAYPFPPLDREPLTRPNHDGPLRYLNENVTFGAAKNLQFLPNGSVVQQDGTSYVPLVNGKTQVTLVKGTNIATITVNSLGKITLVQ